MFLGVQPRPHPNGCPKNVGTTTCACTTCSATTFGVITHTHMWVCRVFLSGHPCPVLNGGARASPKFLGHFSCAHCMRNNNQILHNDQIFPCLKKTRIPKIFRIPQDRTVIGDFCRNDRY